MEQEQKKPWLSGQRRGIVGVALIILPWIVLIGVIILYAISSFIMSSIDGAMVAHAQEFTEADAIQALDNPMYQTGIVADDFFGEPRELEDPELAELSLTTVIASLIRILLSLVGLVCLVMIPIGGVAGVYLLVTNKE